MTWRTGSIGLALFVCCAVALAGRRRIRTPACITIRPAHGWQFMQDGTVFLMFNDQGSPRGETRGQGAELVDGHGASSAVGKGQLTLNLMLSLDPATVGAQGYSEIFQVGETFNGERADRSSASARLPDAGRRRSGGSPLATGIRADARGRAGRRACARPGGVHAPVVGGREPDRRRSAITRFDSTHIAMGVLTASVDRGPFQVESLRVPRRRARREPLGSDGSRRARLVVGPRLVPAVAGLELSGLARIPERAGRARRRATFAGRPCRARGTGSATTDRPSVTVAWGRNRKLGGDLRRLPAEMTRTRSAARSDLLAGRSRPGRDRRAAHRRSHVPGRPQESARGAARKHRLRLDADGRREPHVLGSTVVGFCGRAPT